MIYCQLQILIIDYSLDMFRASLCPLSGEKTTGYCIWSVFAGVSTAKVAARAAIFAVNSAVVAL